MKPNKRKFPCSQAKTKKTHIQKNKDKYKETKAKTKPGKRQ